MSTVRNHCVLVHSEVIEAVWILAESPDQARQLAGARDDVRKSTAASRR